MKRAGGARRSGRHRAESAVNQSARVNCSRTRPNQNSSNQTRNDKPSTTTIESRKRRRITSRERHASATPSMARHIRPHNVSIEREENVMRQLSAPELEFLCLFFFHGWREGGREGGREEGNEAVHSWEQVDIGAVMHFIDPTASIQSTVGTDYQILIDCHSRLIVPPLIHRQSLGKS